MERLVEQSPDQNRLSDALAKYNAKYHIAPAFRISERYDLNRQWNETLPDARDTGCYIFYDADMRLLYIGKSSLRNTLGSRVSSYFGNDPVSGGALPKHEGWTLPPAYLQTIKVNFAYEAPSLEEYLIETLQPCNNTRGLKAKVTPD